MGSELTRRRVLTLAGAGVLAGTTRAAGLARPAEQAAAAAGSADDCVVISSANGLRTVAEARRLVLEESARPVHAAVMGVAIQENDEEDTSVGYGGLPNEEGVVQLDAACMDGPNHNAGAVASLEGIRNPAQVAEKVMDETDHVLLVGPGAKRFALSYGFNEENLLTDRARKQWIDWRARRSRDDDYLQPLGDSAADPARTWGTIHCSVRAPDGSLGCCTTTSGLAFKIPGRVGDSPLIGCGLYCDNEVGSAGATGRGEAAIHAGGSWLVVERMRAGDAPEEACLYALKRVASQAERQARWQPGLWRDGRPTFQLRFYAVRKDGLFGAASMSGAPGKGTFAVADRGGARLAAGAVLFPE